jgi:hypothetical protein
MCRHIIGLGQEGSIRQKVPEQYSSLEMLREMSQMLTVWARHFERVAEFKRRRQKPISYQCATWFLVRK